MSTDILTTVMQYFIGGLLSCVSLVLWGILFYKQDQTRKDLTIFSFCAGVLSVVPIFLVLGLLGTSPISFGSVKIAGLSIYNHLELLASHGDLQQLFIYIAVSIVVFFLMYLIVGIVMFILDIASGEQTVKSYEKILARSIEMPFIFITLGILLGGVAYLVDWSLGTLLYKALMIGIVEEFAKHLVVRFSDENKFRNINDALEFSIIVALGFAFLENILYFVDHTWIAPCAQEEIAKHLCIVDSSTGAPVRNVNSLFAPFVLRSIFSTVTHIVSSAIFGYYYGMATFAESTLQELMYTRDSWRTKIMSFLHKFLHLKGTTILREELIIQGALFAMLYHGLYDFLVDTRVNSAVESILGEGKGSLLLVVPLILFGLLGVLFLFQNPKNKVVRVQKNTMKEDPTLRAMRVAIREHYVK